MNNDRNRYGVTKGWGRGPFRLGLAVIGALALVLGVAGCAAKQEKTIKPTTPTGPLGQAPIQVPWAYQNTVQINHIYGYNVYRSDSPNGGFHKINDDLIVPSPDEPNPQFVVYDDRGLALGKTYYYYLEAVLQDGSRHKATPVYPLRVTRKMTPEEVKAWEAQQAKRAEEQKSEKSK